MSNKVKKVGAKNVKKSCLHVCYICGHVAQVDFLGVIFFLKKLIFKQLADHCCRRLTMPHLTQLHIYPVKSLAGIALSSARVEQRGLQHDRRWMLVRPADGRFVTQRELPGMALLGTAIESQHLVIFDRKNVAHRCRIPLEAGLDGRAARAITVWDDTLDAAPTTPEADAWLSARLGEPLQLVRMHEAAHRPADPKYAPEGHEVSFADGFPFLLIGEASLDDLNQRLPQPVPMDRFRPNFVFSKEKSTPYEEDTWRAFRVGNQQFMGVKPCGRCIVTTIDQGTAERSAEPLRTLASYRRVGNKVLFGQNVVWLGTDAEATVRVGDLIERADLGSESF
jgi:uncharacterized protein